MTLICNQPSRWRGNWVWKEGRSAWQSIARMAPRYQAQYLGPHSKLSIILDAVSFLGTASHFLLQLVCGGWSQRLRSKYNHVNGTWVSFWISPLFSDYISNEICPFTHYLYCFSQLLFLLKLSSKETNQSRTFIWPKWAQICFLWLCASFLLRQGWKGKLWEHGEGSCHPGVWLKPLIT